MSCSSAYDPSAVENDVDDLTLSSSVDNSSTAEEKILGKNDEYKLVKLLKLELSMVSYS